MRRPRRTTEPPTRPERLYWEVVVATRTGRIAQRARTIRELVRTPHEALLNLHRTYGTVATVGAGRMRYAFLMGPEANDFVLSNSGLFSWHDSFESLIVVNGGTALLVSDGEQHRRRRQVLVPKFTHSEVAGYNGRMRGRRHGHRRVACGTTHRPVRRDPEDGAPGDDLHPLRAPAHRGRGTARRPDRRGAARRGPAAALAEPATARPAVVAAGGVLPAPTCSASCCPTRTARHSPTPRSSTR